MFGGYICKYIPTTKISRITIIAGVLNECGVPDGISPVCDSISHRSMYSSAHFTQNQHKAHPLTILNQKLSQYDTLPRIVLLPLQLEVSNLCFLFCTETSCTPIREPPCSIGAFKRKCVLKCSLFTKPNINQCKILVEIHLCICRR